MKFAIVGAMDAEVNYILSLLEQKEETSISALTFYKGLYKGFEIIVSKSGIGKVNMAITITTLILNFNPDLIINSGCAGSVKEKIGTVCLANRIGYHDYYMPDEEYFYDFPKKESFDKAINIIGKDVKIGTFLTGDQFIESIDDIKHAPLDDVVAIDMESMSVSEACKKFEKDYLIIRTICDNLSIEDELQNKSFTSDKSIDITLKIINNYK